LKREEERGRERKIEGGRGRGRERKREGERHMLARAPRGGVTRQGVVLTDLQSLLNCH
jgi:hypothetical protein